MVSISSRNVLSGACALILLGLHVATYQADAKNFFVDDGGFPIINNVLSDPSIKHPKRHIRFSTGKPKRVPDLDPPSSVGILSKEERTAPSGPSPRTSDNPPPPPHVSSTILHKQSSINFGMLPKGERIPPSGPSQRTSESPPPPPHAPSVILHKESGINFGILPKGVRIPPSGPSTRSSDYPPPPPHAPLVILKKESKIKFGMHPRNNPIPPSAPSGGRSTFSGACKYDGIALWIASISARTVYENKIIGAFIWACSRNVLSGACALILLGLHVATYQADAKNFFVDDGGFPIINNVLSDPSIKHPKRHIRFSTGKPKRVPDLDPPSSVGILSKEERTAPSGPSPRTSDNPPPPPHVSSTILHKQSSINFGMLPKGERIPPSGPSQRTSESPPPPPHASSVILHKESGINFGILPKGVRIPPSGPSTRSSDYPPPPPHAPLVILKKESKIKFGMHPRNNPIPPSAPSGGVPS
ncbi:unnamed protein product [Citrullus colocynthis]|uniref:Uncharacterized protein n=1 Tax=Citrullus colocynthis TaxID=252529 RepID=A0ABP0XTY5_9ROSI